RRGRFSRQLREEVKGRRFRAVHVNLGRLYLSALPDLDALFAPMAVDRAAGRRSAVNRPDDGRALFDLEVIAVSEGVGELLLVRDEDDPRQPAPQGVQLGDHLVAPLAVEAAEPLVDD